MATAMTAESIVALPASAHQGLGSHDTDSDWVRAEKVNDMQEQTFPANTVLYVLNNHRRPQWLYSYDGGSTTAQHKMKHVFAAYIFLLHPLPRQSHAQSSEGTPSLAARLATVVTRQASPSFTMVSYRRHHNTRGSKKQPPQTHVGTSETQNQVSSPNAKSAAPQNIPQPTVTGFGDTTQNQTDINVWYGSAESGTINYGESRPNEVMERHEGVSNEVTAASVLPPPRQSLLCLICSAPLMFPSHQLQDDTLDHLQILLVLQLFVNFSPIDDFSWYFDRMATHIQREWLTPLSQQYPYRTAAHVLKFPLARFFRHTLQTESVVTNPTHEQMVLRSCADLILGLFSSKRLYAPVAVSAANERTEQRVTSTVSSQNCQHFSRLIFELIKEVSQILTSCSYNLGRNGFDSLSALVDDILSLIYGESKYQSLRSRTSALLFRRNDYMENAVKKLFKAYITQYQRPQDRHSEVDTGLDARDRAYSNFLGKNKEPTTWGRRWRLERDSVSLVPVAELNNRNAVDSRTPSLLSALVLIRTFASVDITLQGLRFTIAATITQQTLPSLISGSEFVLDGKKHPLNSLPNGLSATASDALFGNSWGVFEYEGCLRNDKSLVELTLYTMPVSTSDQDFLGNLWTPRRLRVQLVLDEEELGNGKYSVSASAEIAIAQNFSHQLDNVNLQWSRTLDVQATYVGISPIAVKPLDGRIPTNY